LQQLIFIYNEHDMNEFVLHILYNFFFFIIFTTY